MHICFLSPEFPRKGATHGGIGTFLLTFSKKLIENGHQVTVAGINGGKLIDEQIDGVRVVTFPASKAKLIGWWRNFSVISDFIDQTHEGHPIDIVEGSELTLAFLRKNPAIKYLIRLHGGHHFFAEGEKRGVNKWKGFQEKKSFQKADGFVAVSDYVKTHTETYLSYHSKPIEVINYPISFDKFYPADPEKTIPFRLVFAGTVCEKKGIRQLIAALPIVAEKFPKIHLEVYGRDWLFPDGRSYIGFLKESISEEILNRVQFHGAVSHDSLPGFYEQAEICIFPSHMETQGLVAPEAMAMEKPVIFSELGPGKETIDHGVNGWLCNPHSPESIAAVIIEALNAKDRFNEIGKSARKKALEKFDPDRMTAKNLEFYQKILNS
ncbi:glycosyltransferase family 1 protein [Algoriphagus lacus]|uniref:Glycosyltransferase family 1 protein n=1 Tax=Algoriphagus lacus TaxID=2056311 RepID=A0A418PLR2_9BACT|nr:glycosyltransferase family 4 protein [Algoriphagus lacus]RIW12248.1 glycosyltransferase family 1 protein [Algoriphagus lacus]